MCAKAGEYCASRGVELGKLSVQQNIVNQEQPVAITLLGVGNMEILRINMEIITHGLTTLEEEVLKEVHDKFFKKMDWRTASWDGKEINEFNKALGKDQM